MNEWATTNYGRRVNWVTGIKV